MLKTKFMITLGPSIFDEEKLRQILKKGIHIFRINFSHGDYEQYKYYMNLIKKISSEIDIFSPVFVQDLKGPEVRTSYCCSLEAEAGEKITIPLSKKYEKKEDEKILNITYPELVPPLNQGEKILIADGKIILEVLDFSPEKITAEVLNGGFTGSHKNVSIENRDIDMPPITEKSLPDIEFGAENGFDYIAVSFTRSSEDLKRIREMVRKSGGSQRLIAKIESRGAVERISEIADEADIIMAARGDLGMEMTLPKMPYAQKHIISESKKAGTPVIVATQILKSMLENPSPTRAEVSDIANIVLDGADGMLLTDETAVGKYPLEALDHIKSIAEEAELIIKEFGYNVFPDKIFEEITVQEEICRSACEISGHIPVKAIVSPTKTGTTPAILSAVRPKIPILAFCHDYHVKSKLCMYFGVFPYTLDIVETEDELIEKSLNHPVLDRFLEPGDLVLIVLGNPSGSCGNTNQIKVLHYKS